MGAACNAGALSDVTILDLTRVLSGPFGTSWLGDMGAKIIKFENPKEGDSTRYALPFSNGESVYYATINRNKKPVTLNLKSEKGREMFLRMVEKADVVAENFRPGVMERLHLGIDELKKVNPKIVLASLSGYGQTGPYAQRPGYDVVGQGMGAIMSLTGFPEDPPTKAGPSLGDIAAGMNFALAILAAVHHARSTGEGQWVEVSLVDSVLALCTQDYIDYGLTKKLPKRLGNNYSLWCPYGTYKAADGYYQIGVGTEKHFQILCEQILRMPELVSDPRYNGQAVRIENRADIDAIMADWSAGLTVAEAVNALNAASIPACPVYDFADVEADENFTVYREMVRHMQHPVIGDISYLNCPIRFSESGLVEPQAAQSMGACNEEIYGSWLGMSRTDLDELHTEGVI